MLLAACGGGDLTLPNEGQPSALTVASGNNQNGTIGEALLDPLVVRVTDGFGDPVAGVTVVWSAETGGTVDPASSVTSADGYASTERVLGPAIGTYVTRAEVSGVADPPQPVVFTTTGVAARLSFMVDPPATAVSGTALEPQPVVQLQDATGEDIARAGVVVTVQISAGGGTLAGTTSATSDPQGRVAFTDLAIRGSPSTRTLIFAADGFASATALVAVGVGAPASIESAAGGGESAVVGTAVATPPAVLVRDADGNPLAGIPVSFKVTGGGGSATGRTPVTGSDGVATVGGWTLGEKAGANTLQATLSGLEVSGSPVVFTGTGTPGPVSAAKSLVVADPAQISASTGTSASTITVTARDAFDNPIAGLAVTLSATGSGNALTQPAGPTGSAGTTTGTLSATIPGDRVVSAQVAGVAVTQTATVRVSAGTPVADKSSATAPGGTAGQVTTIQIHLKDAQGNPVEGRRDAVSVAISGANTVNQVPITEQGSGTYTASYTPQKSGSDAITVKVLGTALSGTLTSTVIPGPPSPLTTAVDVPSRVTVFPNELPVHVKITAFDALGNRITRGGANYEVRVQDGSTEGAPLDLTDNRDGTYSASFNSGTGVFLVHVRLDGTEVKDSPFQVIVSFF
ncbi:MAG TPA: invasin domain 3-containing protein [Gemmatimonadales bacterium]|nr:invasin domain 3-containing protein [Gemmatimonadales bacterium]